MYVCMYINNKLGIGGGVLVVCGECYNLGLIDRPVVFILSPPPLYFVFENSENKRNDLTYPVIRTIFLVYNCVNTSWKSPLKLVDTEYLNAPHESNK